MKLHNSLRILLYSANIWYFGEGMLGPLLAVFTTKIGGDVLNISWAWAIYLVISGLLYILVGKITDKYKNKELIMIIGYVVNTLFTFGYVFVKNPVGLFIVQAGLGVAAAMATPTWYALYTRYQDKDHDGFQWGLAGGTGKIITGIAVVIGGYIVSCASFKVLFIVMGIIQTTATIYQLGILKH